MRKRAFAFLAGIVFLLSLAGCGEELRYGEQINSQSVADASRTQNEIVSDILRNANPIMSFLMNHRGNIYSSAELESMLTSELERVQKSILRLEQFRQPDSLEDETAQTIRALVNYKTAILYLRERVRKGEDAEREVKQFVEAVNNLQASQYVKP